LPVAGCRLPVAAAAVVPTIRGMKTYDIELLKVKSMHQGHGLVYMRLDATVQPQPRSRDDDDAAQEPATVLKLTEDNARVLLLLLKQQLAEFDRKKPKSRF
jgi:hypothetical protein